MANRSLNLVQLIGNTTNDFELNKTPNNSSVVNFSIATNRMWVTEKGEKKEEAEFHRLVAWGKLAEICVQWIKKGTKIYVKGRLATRSFQDKAGIDRSVTEVVLDDMIILENPKEVAQKPTE